VKRGEIWGVAGGPDYAGKQRPVAIPQATALRSPSQSRPAHTNPTRAPLFRVLVQPSERNGLNEASSLMVDKITTVARTRVGKRIGRLDDEDIVRLNRSIVVFLGLGRASPEPYERKSEPRESSRRGGRTRTFSRGRPHHDVGELCESQSSRKRTNTTCSSAGRPQVLG
jgi:mRNA interferase MazF